MSATGPDIVCIGMEKAGTGWLHDQLAHTAGAWMTPVKELNYFHGDPFTPFNLQRVAALRRDPRLAARDRAFLDAFEAGRARDKDAAWYRSLFAGGEGLLTGDISPNYALSSPAEIRAAASALPRAHFVLLVRHPVERAWSAICMRVRKSELAPSEITDPDRVAALLSEPEYALRSYPTRIADKWSAALAPGSLRHWFLEDIAAEPVRVRDEILAFAGLEGARVGIAPDYNRKEGAWKMPMPPAVAARLRALFAAEIDACADRFGGRALEWRSGLARPS